MKGDESESLERLKLFCKSKRFFALLVIVAILSISLWLVGSVFRFQGSQAEDLVNFAVRSYSSNQTFTIGVGVDLTDGIDRNEAILVTSEVFDKVLNFGQQYERSIYVGGAFENSGVWTIELSWAFGPRRGMGVPPQGRLPQGTFISIIYTHNRTVVYEAHYGF